jgi:hypothetical protein
MNLFVAREAVYPKKQNKTATNAFPHAKENPRKMHTPNYP